MYLVTLINLELNVVALSSFYLLTNFARGFIIDAWHEYDFCHLNPMKMELMFSDRYLSWIRGSCSEQLLSLDNFCKMFHYRRLTWLWFLSFEPYENGVAYKKTCSDTYLSWMKMALLIKKRVVTLIYLELM